MMSGDDEQVPIRDGMVFPVWHYCAKFDEPLDYSFRKEDGQQPKRVGVFSTYERAMAEISHYRDLPGFRDWRESFRVFREPLDETAWEEGFVGWREKENE